MKKELIDKMVTDIMDGFDFEKVHNIMMQLGWKWNIDDGKTTVPIIYRLQKCAERMLREVAEKYYKDKETHSIATGGFMAEMGNGDLSLSFLLEEATTYEEDYED